MSKRKKKTELVEVEDLHTKVVKAEIQKLDQAIEELDSKIGDAVEARTSLDAIRTCMQTGLDLMHKQTEISFDVEPEIEVSDDNEITLTFENKDG